MIKAKAAPPPRKPGLAPTAYAIEGARGFGLAIETAGEQPNPRHAMPGAWDLYVWRGEGSERKIGVWRYVHGGTPRERDIKVRLRVMER